jgi:hypothetical protein
MGKDDTQSNQLNLTVVALVAVVAIVGLVALVMNIGKSTGSQFVSAEQEFDAQPDTQNAAGQVTRQEMYNTCRLAGYTESQCGNLVAKMR